MRRNTATIAVMLIAMSRPQKSTSLARVLIIVSLGACDSTDGLYRSEFPPEVHAEVITSSDLTATNGDSGDIPAPLKTDSTLGDTLADTVRLVDVSGPTNDVKEDLRDTHDVRPTLDSISSDTAEMFDTRPSAASSCPEVELPNDFPLALHRLTATGQLGAPLSAMEDIEIVQGPQGGVHVEFGYRLSYGQAAQAKQFAAFTGQTYLQSDEPAVGFGEAALTVLFKAADSQAYDSQENLVIFEQNEAVHYEDRPCCVVATVSILDPIDKSVLARSGVTLALYCIDLF